MGERNEDPVIPDQVKTGKIEIYYNRNKLLEKEVKSTDTVGSIKDYIERIQNIPKLDQSLKVDNEKLTDDETTLENYITKKLFILETPSKPDKDNIEIVKLRVVMKTNKNKKVNLTANLFVFDKPITGEYPLLCTNVKYNSEYLRDKSFLEVVQIFFNEKEFERFLLSSDKTVGDEREVIDSNILFMLERMFPISFPIKDDVQMVSKSEMFNFEKMLGKIFRQHDYVYLNIDKPSTVTQVLWLDTVRSNPEYVQLNDVMRKYKKDLLAYLEKSPQQNLQNVNYKEINSKLRAILLEQKSSYRYSNISREEKNVLDELLTMVGNGNEFNEAEKSADPQIQQDKAKKGLQKKIKENLQRKIDKIKSETSKLLFDKSALDKLTAIEYRVRVNEEEDKSKIGEIAKNYKDGNYTDDDLRGIFSKNYKERGSKWWKLYFIFAGLKKNTSAYNNFVSGYVKRFVLESRDESRYWYNSSSSNEAKFKKNLADIDFHFDFLKKIDDFVSQRRQSMNKRIGEEIFEDSEENFTVHIDKFLGLFNNLKGSVEKASVDKVRETKTKDVVLEEGGSEKKEYKTKFYEIQLGVAVVGGKVPNAPSNFWCAFNSVKHANDYKVLSKYDLGEITLYPYLEIEEQPQEVAPRERQPAVAPREEQKDFSTLLNLKKRGGGGNKRKTRNKRSFGKKTYKRSFHRYFKEK